MGQLHYFAREYAEAEEYCRRALEVAPDFVFAHLFLAYIYLKMGRHEEALVEWALTDKAISPVAKFDEPADAQARRDVLARHRREGLIGYLREVSANKPQGIHDAHNVSLQYQFALYHEALLRQANLATRP